MKKQVEADESQIYPGGRIINICKWTRCQRWERGVKNEAQISDKSSWVDGGAIYQSGDFPERNRLWREELRVLCRLCPVWDIQVEVSGRKSDDVDLELRREQVIKTEAVNRWYLGCENW